MADSHNSLDDKLQAARGLEKLRKEEERRAYELRRHEEKMQEYAAACRREQQQVKEHLQAAREQAARAQRGADWAQGGAVVAVVAALRLLFK